MCLVVRFIVIRLVNLCQRKKLLIEVFCVGAPNVLLSPIIWVTVFTIMNHKTGQAQTGRVTRLP